MAKEIPGSRKMLFFKSTKHIRGSMKGKGWMMRELFGHARLFGSK